MAVEFLIGFMPMATAFLCFTQVGWIYTAHLVFKHAAFAAARAAIVTVEPCNPGKDLDKRRPDDPKNAFTAALGGGAWQHTFSSPEVNPQYNGGEKFGDVKTEVKAKYKCNVPMGKRLVCSGFGFVTMKETITLPHQGAAYDNATGCGDQ
ncbi:hypothetical protein LVJ94_21100 [Pendulispora rubella]|uniref:Pilus assembly protein n=1 Tax=Pendulispora rubella TaxID=2741070 RepID=A0ABZ2LFL2_9BACT